MPIVPKRASRSRALTRRGCSEGTARAMWTLPQGHVCNKSHFRSVRHRSWCPVEAPDGYPAIQLSKPPRAAAYSRVLGASGLLWVEVYECWTQSHCSTFWQNSCALGPVLRSLIAAAAHGHASICVSKDRHHIKVFSVSLSRQAIKEQPTKGWSAEPHQPGHDTCAVHSALLLKTAAHAAIAIALCQCLVQTKKDSGSAWLISDSLGGMFG